MSDPVEPKDVAWRRSQRAAGEALMRIGFHEKLVALEITDAGLRSSDTKNSHHQKYALPSEPNPTSNVDPRQDNLGDKL